MKGYENYSDQYCEKSFKVGGYFGSVYNNKWGSGINEIVKWSIYGWVGWLNCKLDLKEQAD